MSSASEALGSPSSRRQSNDGTGFQLIAAPFTPLDPSGALACHVIRDLADRLHGDGVTGVFICGSNGEGPSLSSSERAQVTEEWIATAKGRLRTMVHVGHSSITEARALARHAAEHGADAASATASFYFRPGSLGDLVDSMAEIAAGAPDLPFYYYHLPAMTGLNFDMVAFLDEARNQIPNFAGIKYTASTIWEYQACIDNAKDSSMEVLFGYDEMLLPAMSVGASGAVGSTYNFAAPLYRQMIEAFQNGRLELARERMSELVTMVRILTRYPAIPAQKAIMKRIGLDVGPCRLPLGSLSQDKICSLYRDLDAVDFWNSLDRVRGA
ncbi:dihydrodipicolinate synthase family protein [Erythrobacter sp. NFXS35]|uniref:dihydrodipicolinate synthase family protein n=1 Tax=Erythrobacter sp. NFXS35 TaxID=2818436 RepID=UPI0032DFF1D3